jgi:hypothetical protein
MVQWLATFFSGGAGYNLAVFLIASAGIGLAVWALCIAYRQLKRVASAAAAASEAADSARARVLGVTGLMSLNELCTLARDVEASVRTERYDVAALRASDLRCAAIRGRAPRPGSHGPEDTSWGELVARIASLDDALDRSARTNSAPPDHKRLTKLAKKVSDTLNGIAAKSASELGEK